MTGGRTQWIIRPLCCPTRREGFDGWPAPERAEPVMTGSATRPTYEIRVRGVLTPALTAALSALNLRTEQTESGPALIGVFRDQAELHGALDALGDLGVELVSVRQLEG
jgi:hypothetical protein